MYSTSQITFAAYEHKQAELKPYIDYFIGGIMDEDLSKHLVEVWTPSGIRMRPDWNFAAKVHIAHNYFSKLFDAILNGTNVFIQPGQPRAVYSEVVDPMALFNYNVIAIPSDFPSPNLPCNKHTNYVYAIGTAEEALTRLRFHVALVKAGWKWVCEVLADPDNAHAVNYDIFRIVQRDDQSINDLFIDKGRQEGFGSMGIEEHVGSITPMEVDDTSPSSSGDSSEGLGNSLRQRSFPSLPPPFHRPHMDPRSHHYRAPYSPVRPFFFGFPQIPDHYLDLLGAFRHLRIQANGFSGY
jgi:hypothetical protein